MELSSCWEVDSCAATQEFSSILWNPNVHYRVHKSPPLVHIQSQMHPVHINTSYLTPIWILSTQLRLSLLSVFFYSGFPTNFYPNNPSRSEALLSFRNKIIFYDEELSAPHPIPKLEDNPLLSVRDCLFNILSATLFIGRLSPPSKTRGRTMPWVQGTHLTWTWISSLEITYNLRTPIIVELVLILGTCGRFILECLENEVVLHYASVTKPEFFYFSFFFICFQTVNFRMQIA
jgi:hypothetical protein